MKEIKKYGKDCFEYSHSELLTKSVKAILDEVEKNLQKYAIEKKPTVVEFYDFGISLCMSVMANTLAIIHDNIRASKKERLDDLELILSKMRDYYNDFTHDLMTKDMH